MRTPVRLCSVGHQVYQAGCLIMRWQGSAVAREGHHGQRMGRESSWRFLPVWVVHLMRKALLPAGYHAQVAITLRCLSIRRQK